MIYDDSIKRIAARTAQATEIQGEFQLYWPVEDWAGIGYPHWMIVHDWTPGVGGGGNSHSGVGHTLDEAAADMIQNSLSICEGGCSEYSITEQDAIGRALEGPQFGKEEYLARQGVTEAPVIVDITTSPGQAESWVTQDGRAIYADDSMTVYRDDPEGNEIPDDAFASAIWDFIRSHPGPKADWARLVMTYGYRDLPYSLDQWLIMDEPQRAAVLAELEQFL